MFVRVFDKNKSKYFTSIVYSIVGEGCFLQYIVLNPRTISYELVDSLDKSVLPARPLVEVIQADCEDFVTYDSVSILKYKHFCEKYGIEFVEVNKMMGYPDVCENYDFLAEILTKKSVPFGVYDISIRALKDENEWDYI